MAKYTPEQLECFAEIVNDTREALMGAYNKWMEKPGIPLNNHEIITAILRACSDQLLDQACALKTRHNPTPEDYNNASKELLDLFNDLCADIVERVPPHERTPPSEN